jgi:LPS-assembly lipoprotein
MTRVRRCVRTGLLVLCAVALSAGCGFQPVAPVAIPFQTLYVTAPAYSSFGAELKRTVENSGRTRLVDNAAGAEAVLEVLAETRNKQILSLSSVGRVREYLLRYRVTFRLRDQAGRDLIPSDTIVLERDLTYDDDAALAKENEEAFLFQDMQRDAVQQLFRRLAAADLAAPGASGG